MISALLDVTKAMPRNRKTLQQLSKTNKNTSEKASELLNKLNKLKKIKNTKNDPPPDWLAGWAGLGWLVTMLS